MKRTGINTAVTLALACSLGSAYAQTHTDTYQILLDQNDITLDAVDVNIAGKAYTAAYYADVPGGFLIKNNQRVASTNNVVIQGESTIVLDAPKITSDFWQNEVSALALTSEGTSYGKVHKDSHLNVTFDKKVDVTVKNADLTAAPDGLLNGIRQHHSFLEDSHLTFKDDVTVTMEHINPASSEVFVTAVSGATGFMTFDKNLTIDINDSNTTRTRGVWTSTSGGDVVVKGLAKVAGEFKEKDPSDSSAFFVDAIGAGADKPKIHVGAAQYEGDAETDGAIYAAGSGAEFKVLGNAGAPSVIKGRTTIILGTASPALVDLTFNDKDSLYRSKIDRFTGASRATNLLKYDVPKYQTWVNKQLNNAVLNLKFENGAKWEVIDKMDWINHLDLTNGGQVTFDGADVGQEIRVQNYVNSNAANRGQITFNVDLAQDKTDWLNINKEAAGSVNFLAADINWKGADVEKYYMKKPLVHQNDGTLTVLNPDEKNVYFRNGRLEAWHLTFLTDDELTGFDFEDNDARRDDTKFTGTGAGGWYLMRDKDFEVPVTPEETDQATLGSSRNIVSGWFAEDTDLRTRLGEVRYGSQAGVWGKLETRKERFIDLFDQKTHGIHLGYDAFTSLGEKSAWMVGGALRYAEAKQTKLDGLGTGKTQQYSAKVYGTYMHRSGGYADLVATVGHYNQSMESRDNETTGLAKADFNTNGFGASVEIGHMFAIKSSTDDRLWHDHFFVEPQLQLSYFHSQGADYVTSTGLSVDQSSSDFLVGRAGVVLGKKFNFGGINSLDKRYGQVEFKAGIKHAFSGNQTIQMTALDGVSRTSKVEDPIGTLYYYGFNVNGQFTDKTRLYGAVEYVEGKKYRQDYAFTVGIKHQF